MGDNQIPVRNINKLAGLCTELRLSFEEWRYVGMDVPIWVA